MTNDRDSRVLAAFQQLPELMAYDQNLRCRGTYLTVEFMVEIGTVLFYLSIAGGRLVAFERGPELMRPWTFAFRAPVEAWSRFWQPIPEAGLNRPDVHGGEVCAALVSGLMAPQNLFQSNPALVSPNLHLLSFRWVESSEST